MIERRVFIILQQLNLQLADHLKSNNQTDRAEIICNQNTLLKEQNCIYAPTYADYYAIELDRIIQHCLTYSQNYVNATIVSPSKLCTNNRHLPQVKHFTWSDIILQFLQSQNKLFIHFICFPTYTSCQFSCFGHLKGRSGRTAARGSWPPWPQLWTCFGSQCLDC